MFPRAKEIQFADTFPEYDANEQLIAAKLTPAEFNADAALPMSELSNYYNWDWQTEFNRIATII